MKDIEDINDIKLMVDSFYEKVNKNEKLSAIFNDFAGVNWEAHLPRMYDFWNTILFSKGEYKGSPFQKHVPLPIDETHFKQWISIFEANLDENFKGPMTEETKKVANSIAQTFEAKLKYMK